MGGGRCNLHISVVMNSWSSFAGEGPKDAICFVPYPCLLGPGNDKSEKMSFGFVEGHPSELQWEPFSQLSAASFSGLQPDSLVH